MNRLFASLALCLAAAAPLAAQDARTTLIVDTPSGINRFVRAAHALDPALAERLRLLDALRSARELEQAPAAGSQQTPEAGSDLGRFRGVGQVYRDTVTGKLFVLEQETQ